MTIVDSRWSWGILVFFRTIGSMTIDNGHFEVQAWIYTVLLFLKIFLLGIWRPWRPYFGVLGDPGQLGSGTLTYHGYSGGDGKS